MRKLLILLVFLILLGPALVSADYPLDSSDCWEVDLLDIHKGAHDSTVMPYKEWSKSFPERIFLKNYWKGFVTDDGGTINNRFQFTYDWPRLLAYCYDKREGYVQFCPSDF